MGHFVSSEFFLFSHQYKNNTFNKWICEMIFRHSILLIFVQNYSIKIHIPFNSQFFTNNLSKSDSFYYIEIFNEKKI